MRRLSRTSCFTGAFDVGHQLGRTCTHHFRDCQRRANYRLWQGGSHDSGHEQRQSAGVHFEHLAIFQYYIAQVTQVFHADATQGMQRAHPFSPHLHDAAIVHPTSLLSQCAGDWYAAETPTFNTRISCDTNLDAFEVSMRSFTLHSFTTSPSLSHMRGIALRMHVLNASNVFWMASVGRSRARLSLLFVSRLRLLHDPGERSCRSGRRSRPLHWAVWPQPVVVQGLQSQAQKRGGV